MTAILTTNPSFIGRNTKDRLESLAAISEPIYRRMKEQPRTVGLYLTPDELNNLIFVRAREYCHKTNSTTRWSRDTKLTTRENAEMVGWKFVRWDEVEKVYRYEFYQINLDRDYPMTNSTVVKKYVPVKFEDGKPDGVLVMPDEGITIEEMLRRMGDKI